MPGGTVFIGGKQLEKSSNKSELLKRVSCAVVFPRREKKKKRWKWLDGAKETISGNRTARTLVSEVNEQKETRLVVFNPLYTRTLEILSLHTPSL